MWRVWKYKEFKWLIITGISYAFVLQSHYLGLLLAPTLAVLWGITIWTAHKSRRLKSFLIFSLFTFSLFTILMSPLVLFDSKHGWHNTSSMKLFFTHRQETVSARPWNAIPDMWPLWKNNVVTDLLTGMQKGVLPLVVALLTAVYALRYLWKHKKMLDPLTLTLFWIVVGLLGLGSLKQNIFSHYFGFLFPAPFLLIGAMSENLWSKRKWFVAPSLIVLALFNLINNPLKNPPQRQMQRVQEIDKKIIEESASMPFNFGLVAERNYDEGYLYFFELWYAPVKQADPQHLSETVTDQLFVVCENNPCNPTTSPKAEIAHFGPTKIDKEWDMGGVKLYKLSHHKLQ